MFFFRCFIILCLFFCSSFLFSDVCLKNNLQQAQQGDYVVISQNKIFILLHILNKNDEHITIEEVVIPKNRKTIHNQSWKTWINEGCNDNNSRILYKIDLATANCLHAYSMSQKKWLDVKCLGNILQKLLNINFVSIPQQDMRKVGIENDKKLSSHIWQPRMIKEGKITKGVIFEAWKAKWPKDNSILANKNIEIYLPVDQAKYLSYFPYCLEIINTASRFSMHIVDTGNTDQSAYFTSSIPHEFINSTT
jgi:hypothetical protein